MKKIIVVLLMLFSIGFSHVSSAATWDVGAGYETTPGGKLQHCVYKQWVVGQDDPYQPERIHTGKTCTIVRNGGYGTPPPMGYFPRHQSKTDKIFGTIFVGGQILSGGASVAQEIYNIWR
ncbi:MAG: hypothetical protein Q8O83_00125 [bacterium]|nr:hypothetical protein [bacterium]